jgi:hypothetical protein
MEVMRQAYRAMPISFEDDDDEIFTQVSLDNLEVQVTCWADPGAMACISVLLPIQADLELLPEVGELLHRLNHGIKRGTWELDYNDGEIRMVEALDLMLGPLTERIFSALLDELVMVVNSVCPYLISVLSGQMTPKSAADHANAAISALMDDGPEEE